MNMLRLNCDLGESYGSWSMGLDQEIMPSIDQANIACGFHAGDPLIMARTVAFASEHKVEIGAHPAYPDLVGFGRRSMNCSSEEIVALLHYQIAALDGICSTHGTTLSYVKPHGALYNDMMRDTRIRAAVMQAVSSYARPLKLMILSTGELEIHQQEASELELQLMLEGFADRRYTPEGQLQNRAIEGAVLNEADSMMQVRQLFEKGTVVASDGKELRLQVDSLCVHGDNPAALNAVREIRQLINASR
ncbi:MAG: 5-oxoprolinase subunit PxpA [Pseudomonadales bacterium]